jgi:hypothetical protein
LLSHGAAVKEDDYYQHKQDIDCSADREDIGRQAKVGKNCSRRNYRWQDEEKGIDGPEGTDREIKEWVRQVSY